MRRTFMAAAAILPLFASLASVSAAPSQTVTLITGDRVTLDTGGHQKFYMQPGKGREHIRFVAQHEPVPGAAEPHLYVIPEDAAPLLAADRLDRRLFDVTELIDAKFGDAHSNELSLLVTYAEQTRSLAATGATISGAVVARQLDSINAVALRAPKQGIDLLWSALTAGQAAGVAGAPAAVSLSGPVKKVWLDGRMQPLLDRSVAQIGAPTAWNGGYFGEGVVVAVIDTGVDVAHPDLAGRIFAQRNFTDEPDQDIAGHGTHVASIIGGSGAASGGKFRGVAPRAQLVSGKVCFVFGCPFSSIIEGMQWAVAEQGAKIVNLSLGGFNGPEIDPVEQAVMELTEQYGALFVAAAGNFGGEGTVNSPSTADVALSVGAVGRNGELAPFSSRGPRLEDKGIKPEITAPGMNIVAARASSAGSGDFYLSFSGTSMATPHVAGAAALLSQLHPQWGPQQLKAALIGSARRNPSIPLFGQGAGRVDVAAAFATTVTADPATLSLGIALWPHSDAAPVTRTVTYRNSGAAAVTLRLGVRARGPAGRAAPRGMFALSTHTLTIPSGASASVELKVDLRVHGADGIYTGAIVAQGAGRTLETPLAIEREAESYEVDVAHIDANGAPMPFFVTTFVPLDRRILPLPRVFFTPAEARVRLPAGRYAVESTLLDFPRAAIIHDALFRVDGPKSLTVDARTAAPLDIEPPTPGSQQFSAGLTWFQRLNWGTVGGSFLSFGAGSLLATRNFDARAKSFLSYVGAQWNDPDTGGSPVLYAGTWVERGALPTGPSKAVDLKQAAIVRATYAASIPPLDAAFAGVGALLREVPFAFFPLTPIALPHERTEIYYGPDSSVRWAGGLLGLIGQNTISFDVAPVRYTPQRLFVSRWNEPPFGPTFPTSDSSAPWATRSGDFLNVVIPIFGDKGGHSGFVSGPARLTLFRDGEKIDEAEGLGAIFDVPPQAANYRLHATASQDAYELSTQLSAAWTFSSEHVAAEDAVPLPLLSLQFKPRLDESGGARRDAVLTIPITARQLTQPGPVKLSALRLEASFDDGASWSRVPVRRAGERWLAFVRHPRQGTHVSLRATARDLSGNGLEQTVVRAYRLTDKVPD